MCCYTCVRHAVCTPLLYLTCDLCTLGEVLLCLRTMGTVCQHTPLHDRLICIDCEDKCTQRPILHMARGNMWSMCGGYEEATHEARCVYTECVFGSLHPLPVLYTLVEYNRFSLDRPYVSFLIYPHHRRSLQYINECLVLTSAHPARNEPQILAHSQ
jgi:hypothetical protein